MPARSKAEKKSEETKSKVKPDSLRKDEENLCPVEAAAVREWLKKLDGGLRERVVCKTDLALAKLVRDMAQHPGATQDKGYFHLVNPAGPRKPGRAQQTLMGSEALGWVGFEGSSDVYDHLPPELWTQVGMRPEAFRSGCARLLDEVCICDGMEEYDTLTLRPSVIRDTSALFGLMKSVTFGAFLEVPAQLKWCPKRRRWCCLPLPAFSCLPLFNLSMFVAHEIEKAIWECFSLFASKPPSIPELISRDMNTFWSELALSQRKELLISLRALVTPATPGLEARLSTWESACDDAPLVITVSAETAVTDGKHNEHSAQSNAPTTTTIAPIVTADTTTTTTTTVTTPFVATSITSTSALDSSSSHHIAVDLSDTPSTTTTTATATAATTTATATTIITIDGSSSDSSIGSSCGSSSSGSSSGSSGSSGVSSSSSNGTTSTATTTISSATTSALTVPEYLFYSPLARFSLPEQAVIAQMKITLRCARAASIEESLVSSDQEQAASTRRGSKKSKKQPKQPKIDEVTEDPPEPEEAMELTASDEEPLSLVVEEVDLLPPSRSHRPPQTVAKPNPTNPRSSSSSGSSSSSNSGFPPVHNSPPSQRRKGESTLVTMRNMEYPRSHGSSGSSGNVRSFPSSVHAWNRSDGSGFVRRNTGILPGGKIGFSGGGGGSHSIHSSFGRSVPTTAPPRSPPVATSCGGCASTSSVSNSVNNSSNNSVESSKPATTTTIANQQQPRAGGSSLSTKQNNGSTSIGGGSSGIGNGTLTNAGSNVLESNHNKPPPSQGDVKTPSISPLPTPTQSDFAKSETSSTNSSPMKPVPLSRGHSSRSSRKSNDAWYSDWFCSPQVAPASTPTRSPAHPSPTPSTPPSSSPPVLWLDWDMGFNDLLGTNSQNLQDQPTAKNWSGLPEATSSLSEWQTSSKVWDRPSTNLGPDSGWEKDVGSDPLNYQAPEQFTLFPPKLQADRSPFVPRANSSTLHPTQQIRQADAFGHSPPLSRVPLRGPPPGFAPSPAEWDKLHEEILSLSKQLKQTLAAKADEENMHRMRLQVERNQFTDQLMLYRDIHQGCLDQIEALKRERDFFQIAHQQTLGELREAQQALESLAPPSSELDPPGEESLADSPLPLPEKLIISEEAPDITISEDDDQVKNPEPPSTAAVETVNPRHPNYRRNSKEQGVNSDARPQRTSHSTPPEPRHKVSLPRLHHDWPHSEIRRRTLPLAHRDFGGMYAESCPNFSTMDIPEVPNNVEPIPQEEATSQPSTEEHTPEDQTRQSVSPSFILCAERSASVPQSPHIRAISKRVRSLSPPPVRGLTGLTVYKDNGQELAPMRKMSWPRTHHPRGLNVPNRRVDVSEEVSRWQTEYLSKEWPLLSVNKPVVSPRRAPPTPPSECPSPSALLRQIRNSPPAEDSERDYTRRQRATSNPESMVQDWPPLHRASTGGSTRSEDTPTAVKPSTGRARSARRVKGVTLTTGVSLPSSTRSRGRFNVMAPSHFTRSRMGFVTFDDPLDLVQEMAERKAYDRDCVYRAQEAPYMLQSQGAAGRSQPHPPWADHSSTSHETTAEGLKPVVSQLHVEIKKFDRYVTRICNAAEVFVLHVIEKIKRIVTSLWDNVEIKKYGSFATGLWLPCSDVDLVIVGGNPGNNEGPALMSGIRSALHSLACELGRRKWVESVRVINNTAVPVIKMIGSRHDTKVMVDITYCPFESSSPHTGLQSNHLLRHYISALPELRPLALVLKQFLFEKGLSQTYTGGLSSYCLVLMLVSFLQSQILLDKQEPEAKVSSLPSMPSDWARQHSYESTDVVGRVTASLREVDSRRHSFDERDSSAAPLKPRRRHSFTMNEQSPLLNLSSSSSSAPSPTPPLANTRRHDLGKLLLGFLELYGRRFDYRHVGIAPQLHTGAGRGCYYTLASATTTLVINDPLDPQGSLDPTKANNIGKGVFAMYRVKAAFDYAFSILSVPSASSRLRRIIDGPPLASIPMSLRTAANLAQSTVAVGELSTSASSYSTGGSVASPSSALSSASAVSSPRAPIFPRATSNTPSFFTFASHPSAASSPSTPTVANTTTPASASLPTTPIISSASVSISKISPPSSTSSCASPSPSTTLSLPEQEIEKDANISHLVDSCGQCSLDTFVETFRESNDAVVEDEHPTVH